MSSSTVGAAIIAGPGTLKQLQRLLPQLSAFDQVVVVDSSGQGAIHTYLKKLKRPYEVHRIKWRNSSVDPDTGEQYGVNDWGFAYARNVAQQALRTTHGLWIDTDDVLGLTYNGKDIQITPRAAANAFRKIADEAPDVDVWFADYHYSYDEHGNPDVVHARERMFKDPASWKIVYPIHECWVPTKGQPRHAMIKDIKFIHLPEEKPEASADRNMRMLQDWYKQLKSLQFDNHDLNRCRLQIGETLWGQRRYKEAAEWLEFEYLENHPEAIDLEKWQAAGFAAKSYISIGNLAGAERMALKCLSIEPGLQDGYYLLAQVKMLSDSDPQDVLELLDVGARKDDPPPQVIRNPLDYTFTPFCITSKCKYDQEQYEVALDFALKALKICPNDERAEFLRTQAASKLREQQATQATMALYQVLADFDEHEKAAQLFDQLPYPVQRQDKIHEIASKAADRVEHLAKPEVYKEFYGNPDGWEPIPWNFFEEGKIPGRDRYTYILKRLKRRPDIKKVLWVGCEDGFHALLLARAGYEVVGIDLNSEAIRIANERAEKLGVNAKFQVAWIEEVRLDKEGWEGAFDAVVASEQIDKARDVSFFLGTMDDCLRPGGILLLTTPDGSWDGGDHPYNAKLGRFPKTVRSYKQDTLEALLRSAGPGHVVTECHFLPYSQAYREGQGWQVAEVEKSDGPAGPRIRIFCGELVEEFSPMNLETGGIGGSETAVIHMAENWAKLGCRVVVYANHVGVHDGVLYRYADEFSHSLESEVFISWRLPNVFGKGRPNATVTVLWNHDLYYPAQVKPEWVDNIDQIVVLSEFHKKWIMDVHPFPEEKIWVTRNGIDPRRFLRKVDKQPHHYFFSSSHERGLEELLEIWPEIKKAIPEAVLHVGYGTYTASEIMKQRRDFEGLDELRGMEQLMHETDGIIYHGRMNQRELAKVQMQCEALLYPWQHDAKWAGNGGFLETYMIGMLEAQAAGAVPITRLNGALPETNKHCIEWTEDLTPSELITILADLSKRGCTRCGVDHETMIQENREWAMSQTWSSLASEWLRKFDALQRSRSETSVPEAILAR